MNYIFNVSDQKGVHLQILDNEGQITRDVPHALTSGDVCRRLHRSRRHLYRYLKRGWLKPLAKFSNELFFDAEEVQRLIKKSARRQTSVPSSMAPLFPDYDIQNLHLERDADMILSRILERGSTRQVRWALRHFSKGRRCLFLNREGARLLSPRAARFWGWLWHIPVRSTTKMWREQGFRPGGIA